jgi:hypothetical protein
LDQLKNLNLEKHVIDAIRGIHDWDVASPLAANGVPSDYPVDNMPYH